VTEPRDEIDAWLEADVEPLQPPPGAFERIRRNARRRKASRALMAVAGAAVAVAAVVTIPQALPGLLPSHSRAPSEPVSSPSRATAASPRPTRPASPSSSAATPSASPALAGGAPLLQSPPYQQVPPSFQPTSVTFISPTTGAAIGQAGTPGHCTGPVPADCTSLAGTRDYGLTWYGVHAPVTSGPDGSAGVSQLRFLDGENAWAYGPQLYVTHDGGSSWTREPTGGLRVTALEASSGRAFAVFAACTGSGPDYAAHCDRFSLYTSRADSDSWQPVPGPVQNMSAASGGVSSASLVLTGSVSGGTGYLLGPNGSLYSGPLDGSAWHAITALPLCPPGAAQAGRTQPSRAAITAGSGQLYLACRSRAAVLKEAGINLPASFSATSDLLLAYSPGTRWKPVGIIPGPSPVTSLAAAAGGLVVAATSTSIEYSTDGGATWHISGGPLSWVPSGGFGYVGMTTQQDGVAIPADSSLGEVFITTDGARTWRPSPIRS
jgi:hypothetical protein